MHEKIGFISTPIPFFVTLHRKIKPESMLIYNTTYHVHFDEAKNFVIWLHQAYIPQALESGLLLKPRLCKILSHQEENSECFSLQFEIEDSARLHEWYIKSGKALQQEMLKIFKEQIVGFTTLMEVIEEH